VFGRGSRDSAQPILDAIERAKSRNCSVVLAEFLSGPLEVKRSFPFGERLRPAGLANVQADSDGVLRRYAFVHRGPDGLEPSLALAAYFSWREIDWSKATNPPDRQIANWMELSADNSALEPRQVSPVPAILNFRSAWDASGRGSFRHYTRTQLQALHSSRQTPDPKPSPLVNSILVVSLVSSGAGDVVTTPFGSNQPGAIIHSTALNDLIQGTLITLLSRPAEAATLCFILPLAWATRFFRRTISLFLMWIFVTVAIIALGVALTLTTNYLMGSVAVASLWTAVAFAELARRYSVLKAPLEIETPARTAFAPNMTDRLMRKQESPVRLVYSYSHRDEGLRDELETHLTLLQRQGVIAPWSDRKIVAGEEWAGRIDEHFKDADIILLLISADFLRSNYCYEIEMENALERHRAGAARVVPIILRDVDWHSAPFGKLQSLPRDGRPITLWTNRDEAWAAVARGIRNVIDELRASRAGA
jgi:CHASE2 domain-containing sensor protein